MTATRDLPDLTAREVGLLPGTAGGGLEPGRPGGRPARRPGRRIWAAAAVAAVSWSLWSAGVGQGDLVNPGGWALVGRFFAAALRPELSAGFLGSTLGATLTTVAFAVLGTALSVIVGLVGGVLTSETWWRRTRPGRRRLRPGWLVSRASCGLPRGIHEAVWGLFLVNILGRDPLVGILAIAIPFGAITAKVYAELIDESAREPFDALRATGTGRLAALGYAVLPVALPDMVSYAFYRLECSLRSAVILGLIGAGGLGAELGLAFQGLAYRRLWTLVYALVAVSAVADLWGSSLRRRGTLGRIRLSLAGGAVLVVASWTHLQPDLGRLVGAPARRLLVEVATSAWPPDLPADGWGGLARRALETVQMSLLAIALASTLAVLAAFLAARGGTTRSRRAVAGVARLMLLVTRAVPPPVWALLLLFVLFPGPLPGAVALGAYNFGILGRLMAEVVENLDHRPEQGLRALGAPNLSAFAYGTLPLATSRFAAYSLYRWEVAARETVVVGVVGAGGLGRLLEQQRAAFNYPGMLATILTLVGVSIAVDLASASARRSLR